jgi:cytochrome c-type biogenesis protein CcmE
VTLTSQAPRDPTTSQAFSAGPPGPRSSRAGRSRKVSWRLLVVGAVLVGALCFLLVKGLSGSLDYYVTVDQALAQKASLGARTFRLEGVVAPGTVRRTDSGVSFVAEESHHEVAVTNTGNPPQLFQPGIPVIVNGHFSGDTFVSNQIIVDHTSTYTEVVPKHAKASKSLRR